MFLFLLDILFVVPSIAATYCLNGADCDTPLRYYNEEAGIVISKRNNIGFLHENGKDIGLWVNFNNNSIKIGDDSIDIFVSRPFSSFERLMWNRKKIESLFEVRKYDIFFYFGFEKNGQWVQAKMFPDPQNGRLELNYTDKITCYKLGLTANCSDLVLGQELRETPPVNDVIDTYKRIFSCTIFIQKRYVLTVNCRTKEIIGLFVPINETHNTFVDFIGPGSVIETVKTLKLPYVLRKDVLILRYGVNVTFSGRTVSRVQTDRANFFAYDPAIGLKVNEIWIFKIEAQIHYYTSMVNLDYTKPIEVDGLTLIKEEKEVKVEGMEDDGLPEVKQRVTIKDTVTDIEKVKILSEDIVKPKEKIDSIKADINESPIATQDQLETSTEKAIMKPDDRKDQDQGSGETIVAQPISETPVKASNVIPELRNVNSIT